MFSQSGSVIVTARDLRHEPAGWKIWSQFAFTDCTKFGQLILRKIIEIVATRCQILRLKCTKFNFGWGSAPDPAGELTTLPQTPYLDLRGRRGGKEKEGRGKGKEKEGRGQGERDGRVDKKRAEGSGEGSWCRWSARGRRWLSAGLRVCIAWIQNVDRSLLLLVVSASVRTIKFFSVFFSWAYSSMLEAVINEHSLVRRRLCDLHCMVVGNKGALFYSPVDFTETSDVNTLMQVWCIGEINRWIKQRTLSCLSLSSHVQQSIDSQWYMADCVIYSASSSVNVFGTSHIQQSSIASY